MLLSLVENWPLYMLFVLSQSKKNYDVRRKEANEVEQAAEKTSATSKNLEKVRQINELARFETYKCTRGSLCVCVLHLPSLEH